MVTERCVAQNSFDIVGEATIFALLSKSRYNCFVGCCLEQIPIEQNCFVVFCCVLSCSDNELGPFTYIVFQTAKNCFKTVLS